MGTRDSQKPSPAICPRCGNWYPAGARRCPIHRVVLMRPDERVRHFGPEDLSSTIQTVVEPPPTHRPRLRRRGRWPSQKPQPLKFFEATTCPGEEAPHNPDPVGSLATVIPDAVEATSVEVDRTTSRRRINTLTPPVRLLPDPADPADPAEDV
jgi:hypothetical protein